jgi:Domain of unknown function (DUF4878)
MFQPKLLHRAFSVVILLAPAVCYGVLTVPLAQQATNSPSDTVRGFYKAMRERKFQEAFAMSIYQPAVEGLKPEEFEDLRPDFEKMAAAIPESVDISGEQISGDAATVFVKVKDGESTAKDEPVSLMRINGAWIIGDKENQDIVKKAGKQFFFNARIDTHHSEVQSMLQRIALAQAIYGQQHTGQFGDLAALINAGLVPKDLEGTETTGYRFHVNVSPDAKTWTAAAEPAQYGRSGRLSFFLDRSGVRSKDLGGKPFQPAPEKP